MGAAAAALALWAVACGGEESTLGPEFPQRIRLIELDAGSFPAPVDAEPTVVILHSEQQAERALADHPAVLARVDEFDYDLAALVVVLGGCQLDAGYRIELNGMELAGRRLTVTGRITRDPELVAAASRSVPYLVAAVPSPPLGDDLSITLDLRDAEQC